MESRRALLSRIVFYDQKIKANLNREMREPAGEDDDDLLRKRLLKFKRKE